MLDEHQGSYDSDRYARAAEAIARARETEGVTEGGMMRTAIVESAAAITEALFNLAGSNYQHFDPEDLTSLGYKLSDIAEAI